MNDLGKTGPENDCKELCKAFQGVLSWKWDSRFETVLAEFSVKKKDDIRAVLDRYLRTTWEGSGMGNAPDPVRAIDNRLGGLRPGQLLLTSDPSGEAFIYCAWWPWGDGKTISIRIAPSYQNLADAEKAEKTRLLKGWFGI
jgi:hypothetical protein